jgi:hypothetical protein
MSTYLALDKQSGDLITSPDVGIQRVDEGRFVVQQVQCKLRTALNEWILDPTIGWLNFSDYEKNFDQFSIETRARKIILGTQGVDSIQTLSVTYVTKTRSLLLQFEALTIYGAINLTIPWG